jgi:dsRNA-specific ribonuclease
MDNPINTLINKDDVENILNYFGNIGLDGSKLEINNLEPYRIAFTHESYYQSIQKNMSSSETVSNNIYLDYIPNESNERLEFLGDHILKAIMGRYLYERFPNDREGFLTTLKIKIEKGKMLHKIGIILGFKNFILLSLQVENQTLLDSRIGRNTPSYYEDCFEAFVGAIFEDFGESGYIYADRFVRNVIEHIIDFSELNSTNDNFKDILQRYYQSLKWKTPVYSPLTKEGPVYRVIFTRVLLFTEEQFNTVDKIIQNKIMHYNNNLLKYYKELNDGTYEKIQELLSSNQQNLFILGVGVGRKITESEQECAKECMKNLNIDFNS